MFIAVALLACHVQYRYGASAGPGPNQTGGGGGGGGSTGGGGGGGGATGAGGGRSPGGDPRMAGNAGEWGPMERGGLTLGQLAGNYNVAMNHSVDPGTRAAAAKECIRFAGHARSIGAADSMQIDLTHAVGAHGDAAPPPGAATLVTLGKAEADCRAAVAPAEREREANKASQASAAKAKDEKALAPYRKVLSGDKLATFTNYWNDYGEDVGSRIVDRDCVRFASPQAMARARVWYAIATDSVETVRRNFYEDVWSVEKIEWKGDKLGRDVPNLHSGKGSYPPAAACR